MALLARHVSSVNLSEKHCTCVLTEKRKDGTAHTPLPGLGNFPEHSPRSCSMASSDSSSCPLSLLLSVSVCSSPACVGGNAPEHNPSSSSSCVAPRPAARLEALSAVPKTPEHNPNSSPMLASIAFSSRLSRINCLLWERGAPGRGPTLRKPSESSNWEWGSSSREKRPWESPPRPGPEDAPPRGPESAPGDGGAYKSWESSTGRHREGSESLPEL